MPMLWKKYTMMTRANTWQGCSHLELFCPYKCFNLSSKLHIGYVLTS